MYGRFLVARLTVEVQVRLRRLGVWSLFTGQKRPPINSPCPLRGRFHLSDVYRLITSGGSLEFSTPKPPLQKIR